METSPRKITAQGLAQMVLSEDAASRQTEERVCEQHGEYISTLYFGRHWSGCEKCSDEKRARENQEHLEQLARDWRESRMRHVLGRAAIPPRFADRRLENFVAQGEKAQRAYAIAKGYADNFELNAEKGACLIFCGGVGTGKTHLAIGIAHALMERDLSPVFTSVMGAVRSVKETYSRDSQLTERDVIRSFVEPDLLILDEVGVQFGSDTEKLILFEIINGRYEAIKPTIVISNLAVKSLEEFLGERAFDRLREGGGKLVVFDWPSYRKQAA